MEDLIWKEIEEMINMELLVNEVNEFFLFISFFLFSDLLRLKRNSYVGFEKSFVV